MSDILATTNTSASMWANATFSGTLGTTYDRDWIRLWLQEGQTIRVNLDGVGVDGLENPVLRVLDWTGDQVGYNDDVEYDDYNSQLTFQADTTGSYYIEAASYQGSHDGDYRITTQKVGPLDSLGWGTQLETETVNVYFAPDGETFDDYTSEGFNAYERTQIQMIVDDLSDVINLDFKVVTNASQADLTLVLDLNETSNEAFPFLGYFNPPGTTNEGIGVFNGDQWDRTAGGDLERGGYGYVTVVHELLHGLGMAHPHDTGGTSSIMTGVKSKFGDYGDDNLNQGVFTVMTYNSGYFMGTDGSAPANASSDDFGYEGGAMALDIAYLQQIYGANTIHASGGNTYVLARTNTDGTYWEAIWDTGGIDTIRHDGSKQSTINLRAATLQYEDGGGGFVSAVNGVAGGYTIANGVIIENAVGGSGRDTITGNKVANVLLGRGGADKINGSNGADKIQGNGGSDTLSGGRGSDTIKGGAGNDKITGGRNADVLNGGTGRDTMRGGGGRDELIGGTKADVLNGGSGRDVLTGGGGSDTFVFTSLSHSRGNKVDTITDFNRGFDEIDLSGLDANRNLSGNQSFEFIGKSGFDAAGQIRIVRDGGDIIVRADVNGDGRADFEILLEDISGLSANNFSL
jgi:serralysin